MLMCFTSPDSPDLTWNAVRVQRQKVAEIWADLEDEFLAEPQLPFDSRARDAAWGHILGPFCTLQAEEQFVTCPEAALSGGFCARAAEFYPDLTSCAAKAHIGLGEQKGERLGDRVVGPGDGDVAADDT